MAAWLHIHIYVRIRKVSAVRTREVRATRHALPGSVLRLVLHTVRLCACDPPTDRPAQRRRDNDRTAGGEGARGDLILHTRQ